MVNTKQLLSFEKENINLTELKLDEADRLAETDNTRFTHSEIFDKIKEGTKTIELRLNDEKRSLLKVGDEIEFTNRDTNEKLSVDIINLHKYPSFKELYKHFNKIELGYAEDEPAESKDMEAYYSKEEQDKYGVLGIEIRKK